MWLLVIEILGVIAFPLTFFLLKRLPDRGATLSKVLGLLITSYLLWVLGLTGLVPYSRFTVIVVVLVIAVVSAIALRTAVGRDSRIPVERAIPPSYGGSRIHRYFL